MLHVVHQSNILRMCQLPVNMHDESISCIDTLTSHETQQALSGSTVGRITQNADVRANVLHSCS